MSASRQRATALLVCLMLIAATAILYAPVRDYDFVRFDDPRYVSENPHIQDGVTFEMIRWSLTSAYKSNWHPLTWMSHALDIELFGVDPGPHHLVNVALHLVNTLLIFGLLFRMTRKVWRSAFVAAVFAIHPMHIESVAWISERKDVLSTFFGLLAIGSYVEYARTENDRLHSVSLGFFAASLFAKGTLVTLPFLLLLLDYWPLRRMQWPIGEQPASSDIDSVVALPKLLREKVEYFFLLIPIAWVTSMAQSTGGALRASDLVSLPLRIGNALVAYVSYLFKAFWPTDLAVHYPHPEMAIVGGVPLTAVEIAASAVLLAAITGFVCWQRERRYLFVGWMWFLGMLIPTIGILQVGTQSHADRYLYVPMVGLSIALTWGVAECVASLRSGRVVARGMTIGAAVIALGVLWIVSAQHLPTWRNSVTLFEQALRLYPNNTVMLNNLGNELVDQGRLDDAIEIYLRGVAVAPNFRMLRENLDEALAKRRRRDQGLPPEAQPGTPSELDP